MSEEIKELIEQLGYKEFYRYYEEKNKLIKDLQQKVEQLEKENEKLKYLADDSKTMKAFIVEHNKVEQLENIINELKKYLIEMSDRSWDDNGAYDDVLDKLKELKEK